MKTVQQSNGGEPASKQTYLIALLLFTGILLSSLFTPVMYPTSDAVAARLLPISIIRDGDFYFDEFIGTSLSPDDRYFLKDDEGRNITGYPIGTPLLILPLYIGPVLTGWVDDMNNLYSLSYLSALFLTAITTLVIFVTARLWVRDVYAGILAFASFFGTNLWSIASRDLWQHGAATLMLALSLYLFTRLEDSRRWLYVLLGFTLGWAVLSRYSTVVFVVVFLAILFWQHRKHLQWIFLGACIPAIIFVWYNFVIFEWPFQHLTLYSDGLWIGPFRSEVLGVWLSPSKGLLWFSPFFVLSLIGFFAAWKKMRTPHTRALIILCVLSLIVSTVLYGSWFNWEGAAAFGPRMTIETIPFLMLGLALGAYRGLFQKRWVRVLFAILVGVSVLTHWIGVTQFTYHWHTVVGSKDIEPWLVRDGQLWFYYERFFF